MSLDILCALSASPRRSRSRLLRRFDLTNDAAQTDSDDPSCETVMKDEEREAGDRARWLRIEAYRQRYLQHKTVVIQSALLRGPFTFDPWSSSRKRKSDTFEDRVTTVSKAYVHDGANPDDDLPPGTLELQTGCTDAGAAFTDPSGQDTIVLAASRDAGEDYTATCECESQPPCHALAAIGFGSSHIPASHFNVAFQKHDASLISNHTKKPPASPTETYLSDYFSCSSSPETSFPVDQPKESISGSTNSAQDKENDVAGLEVHRFFCDTFLRASPASNHNDTLQTGTEAKLDDGNPTQYASAAHKARSLEVTDEIEYILTDATQVVEVSHATNSTNNDLAMRKHANSSSCEITYKMNGLVPQASTLQGADERIHTQIDGQNDEDMTNTELNPKFRIVTAENCSSHCGSEVNDDNAILSPTRLTCLSRSEDGIRPNISCNTTSDLDCSLSNKPWADSIKSVDGCSNCNTERQGSGGSQLNMHIPSLLGSGKQLKSYSSHGIKDATAKFENTFDLIHPNNLSNPVSDVHPTSETASQESHCSAETSDVNNVNAIQNNDYENPSEPGQLLDDTAIGLLDNSQFHRKLEELESPFHGPLSISSSNNDSVLLKEVNNIVDNIYWDIREESRNLQYRDGLINSSNNI